MPQVPPPPPPFAPSFDYPVANDPRAVLSLVLGLASMVTCGVTGIPAVVVGVVARNSIQRAGGAVRGEGIAAWGIATGVVGTAVGMMSVAMVLAGIAAGARGTATAAKITPTPAPTATVWTAPTPMPAPTAASPSAGGTSTYGTLRVVDLSPDASLGAQLESEYAGAKARHDTLLLMTDDSDCDVCTEIDGSFGDLRMQKALSHVTLVRANIGVFARELNDGHMLEHTLPWFYKLDKPGVKLQPVDAISAGEWGANVPENMAPVLGQFVLGTLKTRRDDTSGIGTPL